MLLRYVYFFHNRARFPFCLRFSLTFFSFTAFVGSFILFARLPPRTSVYLFTCSLCLFVYSAVCSFAWIKFRSMFRFRFCRTRRILVAMASANGPSSMSSLGTGCAEGFAAALNTLVALVRLWNRERPRKETGKRSDESRRSQPRLFYSSVLT